VKYFNTTLNALFTATLFSLFIYLEYFDITNSWINILAATYALYRILLRNRLEVTITGFFIGILWFYWISFSFRFYDLFYLIPFVIIGFGLIYALLFAVLAYFKNPFYRGIVLVLLSLIEPFNFNWFKVELLFINTPLSADIVTLGVMLFLLALSIRYHKLILLALPLLLLLPQPTKKDLPNNLNIKIVSTDVSQYNKWNPSFIYKQIKDNLVEIKNAKEQKYDAVLLPESVFPLYLNKNEKILSALKELSHSFAIIAGGLYKEDNHVYNATYFFHDGEMQIAKKMVLVPFGEYTPLPGFIRDWINETFFNGAEDYLRANRPTDFIINSHTIRNAICYEATSKELFQSNPKIMVAMSNNAWFTPSIEPTLQKLLLTYYARKFGTIIYHSANSQGSAIIR